MICKTKSPTPITKPKQKKIGDNNINIPKICSGQQIAPQPKTKLRKRIPKIMQ